MRRYFLTFWAHLSLSLSFCMESEENKEDIKNIDDKHDSFVILLPELIEQEKTIVLESFISNQDIIDISEKNNKFAIFLMESLGKKTCHSTPDEKTLSFIHSIAQDVNKMNEKNLHELVPFLKKYDLSSLIGSSTWHHIRDLKTDSLRDILLRFPEWFIDFKGDDQFAHELLKILFSNDEISFAAIKNKDTMLAFLQSPFYKNCRYGKNNIVEFFIKNSKKTDEIPKEMIGIAQLLNVRVKDFNIFFQLMIKNLTKKEMITLHDRFNKLIIEKKKEYVFCSDDFFIALAKISQKKIHYLNDNFLNWLLNEERRGINHTLLDYMNTWSERQNSYFINTLVDWLGQYDLNDDIIILIINETMEALTNIPEEYLTPRLDRMGKTFLCSFGLVSYGFGQNRLLASETKWVSSIMKNFFYLPQKTVETSIRLSTILTEKLEDPSSRIFYYSLKLSKEYEGKKRKFNAKGAKKFLERIKTLCPNEKSLKKALRSLCRIKNTDREEAFTMWEKSPFRTKPEYLRKLSLMQKNKWEAFLYPNNSNIWFFSPGI